MSLLIDPDATAHPRTCANVQTAMTKTFLCRRRYAPQNATHGRYPGNVPPRLAHFGDQNGKARQPAALPSHFLGSRDKPVWKGRIVGFSRRQLRRRVPRQFVSAHANRHRPAGPAAASAAGSSGGGSRSSSFRRRWPPPAGITAADISCRDFPTGFFPYAQRECRFVVAKRQVAAGRQQLAVVGMPPQARFCDVNGKSAEAGNA